MMKKIIVLFRKDFRITDNPALTQAGHDGTVAPIYIYDEHYDGDWSLGGASKWWLHYALEDLTNSLQNLEAPLHIYKGNTIDILKKMVQSEEIDALYFNKRYEPHVMEQDEQLIKEMKEINIDVQTFEGHLILPPLETTKENGDPYKVFTPFYKSFRQKEVRKATKKIRSLKSFHLDKDSLKADELSLLPTINWTSGMEAKWDVSEKGAWETFKHFVKHRLRNYEDGRDVPAEESISNLSPYLAFGQISSRYIYQYLLEKSESLQSANVEKQISAFLRQLVWREFSYHLLYFFPHTVRKPLNEKFTHFKWKQSKQDFKAWTKGKTGYPLVDAGMRELWETGVMHNRVRMVAASFLVKHLLLPWQKGSEWFWDTLVDADLANNTMGWQWVAGSGADAAPYFRIFNPTTQAERFDEDGEYIKKWIPELAKLPTKYIHKPWEASDEILKKAEVSLGKNYPKPIVDHKSARERALEHYDEIK
ncbi:cryptochrome/photolyase family protein [Priestia koreensis]|uniref:cryptochrome/photolyase family protein n=1 Tax=Priestia koreensis TaxID=284581 RepID=UPI003D05782C